MWQEKLGGYLIDVSKYVLTGVVIASLFRDLGESKLLIYGRKSFVNIKNK